MSKEFVNAVSTEIKRKEVSKTFVGTQPKQEIKTDD